MNIETALRELQSFGNTPEDMSAAISIAWDGFEQLPEKTEGLGCALWSFVCFFILFGFGLIDSSLSVSTLLVAGILITGGLCFRREWKCDRRLGKQGRQNISINCRFVDGKCD